MPLRGGALVSRLYGHIQHGDPATRALVRRILDSVCAPLYAVLGRFVSFSAAAVLLLLLLFLFVLLLSLPPLLRLPFVLFL